MKNPFTYLLVFTVIVLSCKSKSNSPTVEQNDLSIAISADTFEVSVGQFREFVEAKQYQTTADSFGWSGFFDLKINNWSIKEKANWEFQDGINKSDDNMPVVHVSYYDACAYCKWKGGRLPSADEWDLIAGDTVILGNVWQGLFPELDEGKDGYKTVTAPVGQFAPNEQGYYDIFGNVWEWTSTLHSSGERILKGGSFLCDYNVCQGYIPSRFQKTADDSGLNHLGIRCIYDKVAIN